MASARTRLPERGLMDPFPLLQELRPGGSLIGAYHDSPVTAPRPSGGVFDPAPNTTVAATNDVHDWERQLQENRSRARTASIASKHSNLTITLEELDEPAPRPTHVRHRAMHVPTRTRDSSTRRAPTYSNPTPHSSMPTAPHEQLDHGAPATDPTSGSGSAASSLDTVDTRATSILPPLQAKGPVDDGDPLVPLEGDDPASFDLVAPPPQALKTYSLEQRSSQLFSREHLEIIFADPSLLLKFTSFLSTYRPRSIPILIYHLDALKALKAISYANAVADSLEPLTGHDFTTPAARPTVNAALEAKANEAFDVLVRDDLPAYITHIYTQVVTRSITKRITGTLSPQLRDASEGLAEVFCLSDPTRPDNPIIFASEEFHRTTQYGMRYAIGRNCRFLQGPRTNPYSVGRLRDAVEAGQEHCETFLN
ncbi:MAG: hypothetical protein M1823_002033 [Watsoniomyces obsoletus]|nr:MAG: hypothetical protein M1823_002033 [Watsoniomyces obsoletus]